jgi:hypothetical protein
MSHGPLPSDYPKTGAFVAQMLEQSPDAIAATIEDETMDESRFETRYVDNKELVDDLKGGLVFSETNPDAIAKAENGIFRGIRIAYSVARHSRRSVRPRLRDGFDYQLHRDERAERVIAGGFVCANNYDEISEAIDECQEVITRPNENVWYPRLGLTIGFYLVECGEREIQKELEDFEARVQSGSNTIRLDKQIEVDSAARVLLASVFTDNS